MAVRDVAFADGELPEIRFSLGHREVGCRVRVVADASGRRTFLGSRLKMKVKDPVFDQYAIHTWFEGYDRTVAMNKGSNKGDYIYVHFLPITNSWVWQIPITDTITSIGVVTQRKHFAKSKEGREAFFWECVASRPELSDALRKADQIRGFTEEGDYSYAMKQITGDGWLMGDTGRRAYAAYETTLRRGTRNWYNFITVYYRLNALFTAFITDPRYRLDVLKLLQGDVYDEEEPEVLARMREIVATVETDPDHPWHRLLGDLTADAFKPAF